MEKRYQVFISSTFRDLQEERQAVLRAALELGHMPSGMELFPAADDTAWELIRDVIDASDYYVLIVGGRYGSLDESGIGFTEREYDYAVAQKKPVIPLLHENPDNLPRDKTETEPASWEKLKAFRAKIEKNHTCVYWRNADDLKAKVILGLTANIKMHPATGWLRADQVPSGATLADVLTLRNRVADLEAEAAAQRTKPPAGTDHLAQGDDDFEIDLTFDAREDLVGYPPYRDHPYTGSIRLSWNDIFGAIAPTLINEAPDDALRQSFQEHFETRAREAFSGSRKLKNRPLLNFEFEDSEIDTCLVQLRALGLIRESQRQRSLRDTGTYWTLTPYGDYLMTQLRAIRRQELREGSAVRASEPTER